LQPGTDGLYDETVYDPTRFPTFLSYYDSRNTYYIYYLPYNMITVLLYIVNIIIYFLTIY
jgi:hypothetical protein